MTRWTFVAIMEEAAKYHSRAEFFRRNQYAYKLACKHGMMDLLFPKKEKASFDRGTMPKTALWRDPPGFASMVKAVELHKSKS